MKYFLLGAFSVIFVGVLVFGAYTYGVSRGQKKYAPTPVPTRQPLPTPTPTTLPTPTVSPSPSPLLFQQTPFGTSSGRMR